MAIAEDRLRRIRLLAMDVDGVLTDGSMVFDGDGETKVFHVHDGLGISVANAAGLAIAWISGNLSDAVARRGAMLGVTEVRQGVGDKRAVLERLMAEGGFARDEVAFVGDDLNDLPAFEAAGLRIAVGNAVDEMREAADWVTDHVGGRGAVREVIEAILRAQGRWQDSATAFLDRQKRRKEGTPWTAQ